MHLVLFLATRRQSMSWSKVLTELDMVSMSTATVAVTAVPCMWRRCLCSRTSVGLAVGACVWKDVGCAVRVSDGLAAGAVVGLCTPKQPQSRPKLRHLTTLNSFAHFEQPSSRWHVVMHRQSSPKLVQVATVAPAAMHLAQFTGRSPGLHHPTLI